MSDFKANTHQIQFRLGHRPTPPGGSLQRSPRPPAGFKGTLLLWAENEGKGKEGDKTQLGLDPVPHFFLRSSSEEDFAQSSLIVPTELILSTVLRVGEGWTQLRYPINTSQFDVGRTAG